MLKAKKQLIYEDITQAKVQEVTLVNLKMLGAQGILRGIFFE